ncbi:MAG TPA: nuclear transport factor 2 family protein [Acidimicrobiales bacterium]|jgi:hypothetical protein|nr:nuclear transport factor 2 family protein [Acidimicrobiales bacterium]
MPELELTPVKSALRMAMEARDLPAIVDAFAPDAVFRSPLTSKLKFEGREEITAITTVILDVFEGFHYTDELMGDSTGFLVSRARVDSVDIEMVDHILYNRAGKIAEFTVFFRPLPAAAVALRVIGGALGRRKSPTRAALISNLARPLGFMTKIGDEIGVRLIRSAA